MLGAVGSAVEDEHGRRGCDYVDDADDGLLGHAPRAGQGEEGRADEGEGQGEEVGPAPLELVVEQ